jgi:hypothetical protein
MKSSSKGLWPDLKSNSNQPCKLPAKFELLTFLEKLSFHFGAIMKIKKYFEVNILANKPDKIFSLFNVFLYRTEIYFMNDVIPVLRALFTIY